MIAFSNAKAGEMITAAAPILLPMSLTMISTSMLNSMGFEKQSFIFYFVGAAAMLLCILTLPALCGIYAYLIGLGASFALTALCNLTFLRKKRLIFQKQAGQVRVHRTILPLLFILPITFLGKISRELFSHFMGQGLSLFLTFLLLSTLTILLYLVCGFTSLSAIKTHFTLSKQKNRPNCKNEGF